ncbi:MAG: hypothetical protein RLY16_2035 [Bacteroidota bacterium]
MKVFQPYYKLLFWVILALLVHFIAGHEDWVERYYVLRIFPQIGRFFAFLFSWIPFSVGDLLYGAAGIFLVYCIVKLIYLLCKRAVTKSILQQWVVKTAVVFLVIYVFFNVLWGFQYNRIGVAKQLGLQTPAYTLEELIEVDSILLQQVNRSKQYMLAHPTIVPTVKNTFEGCKKAYQQAVQKYPFLQIRPPHLKTSMWGWLGNYTGFMGYYNPFTGEAQVNTTVPIFLQPFTGCHEIAHQLGYAKENEANFVGFLAATASKDTFFHYSVYLDLFLYANRNLYEKDSAIAKHHGKQLLPEIKKDLLVWKQFNKAHQSLLEPIFRWLYGQYLVQNRQPSGILSYDEVTGFVIAFYKKFGRL